MDLIFRNFFLSTPVLHIEMPEIITCFDTRDLYSVRTPNQTDCDVTFSRLCD